VEGSVPSEKKEETPQRVRAGDVGEPEAPGSLSAQTERRIFVLCFLLCVMMVVIVDRLAARDKRRQRKQLQSKHLEKWATGEEGATYKRLHKQKLDAAIDANNEKIEVLRCALLSRMDMHQVRTMSTQEEMKPKWIYTKRRRRQQYAPSGPSCVGPPQGTNRD
jgi:hypothetical protein